MIINLCDKLTLQTVYINLKILFCETVLIFLQLGEGMIQIGLNK
jgi:hypothetical protein